MIILYHKNNAVTQVWDDLNSKEIAVKSVSIAKSLFEIANRFPQSLILWCHESQRDNLNMEKISEIFHHKMIMASYTPSQENYILDSIGYVEQSLFIRVNKNSKYPTWQASSIVGGIFNSVLLKLEKEIVFDKNFDYFLYSLAKLSMPKGLLCYSEPRLLLNKNVIFKNGKADTTTVFRFVKQHYKLRWIFLLLLNFFVHERKIPLFSFFRSFFYKKRKLSKKVFEPIFIQSSKGIILDATFDVVIPTIGRGKYLYEFLLDLSNQTYLPQRVIVVEQNPEPESQSNLSYLQANSWPFAISHIFTHQAGACNARNLGLAQIESEWVFLADDDIRIEKNFLEEVIVQIKKYGNEAYTLSCLQANEKVAFNSVFQWNTFGSGCSIAKSEILKNLQFNLSFEFGYGEDADFGMQLRNRGHDVLYLPHPQILHLKAPIGGFRTKLKLAWANEKVQPKPSPTVMLYRNLHHSAQQLDGYKTVSFFKFYKHQPIRNPFRYYKNFKSKWAISVYWANRLNDLNKPQV